MNGRSVGWLARQARAAPSRKEELQHRFSYFCDNPSSRLSLMLKTFAHKEVAHRLYKIGFPSICLLGEEGAQGGPAFQVGSVLPVHSLIAVECAAVLPSSVIDHIFIPNLPSWMACYVFCICLLTYKDQKYKSVELGVSINRCTECKKSNQESGDLRAPFLIHTGEKPIQLPDPIQEHAFRHK